MPMLLTPLPVLSIIWNHILMFFVVLRTISHKYIIQPKEDIHG